MDTLGLMLDVVVHAASIQDRRGAKWLFIRIHQKFPTLRLIWADGGYTGALIAWSMAMFGWVIEVVKRSDVKKGFHVLPKRWIVERTFAWLLPFRRLSKDYEHSIKSSELMVKIAMISIMSRRLANAP